MNVVDHVQFKFQILILLQKYPLIMNRNDSVLGYLHLALAYRYYFCMEETWEHVSVHWQQGNYQLYLLMTLTSAVMMSSVPLYVTKSVNDLSKQNDLICINWADNMRSNTVSLLMMYFNSTKIQQTFPHDKTFWSCHLWPLYRIKCFFFVKSS